MHKVRACEGALLMLSVERSLLTFREAAKGCCQKWQVLQVTEKCKSVSLQNSIF